MIRLMNQHPALVTLYVLMGCMWAIYNAHQQICVYKRRWKHWTMPFVVILNIIYWPLAIYWWYFRGGEEWRKK